MKISELIVFLTYIRDEGRDREVSFEISTEDPLIWATGKFDCNIRDGKELVLVCHGQIHNLPETK